MHYCKKCRRPLKPKEKDFCPACQLEKWHKKKIWAGIFGGVAVAVEIGRAHV